ncbi:MAG: DUF2807 domain-containing protein [Dyella sp.]
MRLLVASLLLLVPLAAAADECRYQSPRNFTLDLQGVRSVHVQLNSHDLQLHAGDGNQLRLQGRACASDPKMLDGLVVNQHREGDRLVIEATTKPGFSFNGFGNYSAGLQLDIQLPATLPVMLDIGSGDAHVRGLRQLRSQISSGDLHAEDIAGAVEVGVGSGDVELSQIGSLAVGALGSGDLKATGIQGDVRVGTVGSGDLELRKVGGNVRVETVGSGDLSADDVRGGLSVGVVGSGDVRHRNVAGKVDVPRDD